MEAAYTNQPTGLKYDFGREEVLPFVPQQATRLLDIGCGSGAFGQQLRRHRPDIAELWAVEPDPIAARAARAQYNNVAEGYFPDALEGAEPGTFDCIVFNDVLEHMVEPEDALRSAAALLAPGGRIVASIPNVRHISVVSEVVLRGDFRYTERGILDRTHLRFFTRISMLRLFADSGLTVVQTSGINMPRRHKLISGLTGGLLKDLFYPQYVVVGTP